MILDPEFENLIPALSVEEKALLEADLQAVGCLIPFIVWRVGRDDILIDGHHRYEICQRLEIALPEIIPMTFDDRNEALAWCVNHQLGRRNLNDAQRVALALKLKPSLEQKAQERTGNGPVRDQIAEKAEVSPRTVDKVEAVLDSADEETIREMMDEEISISAAAEKVKEKKKTRTPATGCELLDNAYEAHAEVRALIPRLRKIHDEYEAIPAEVRAYSHEQTVKMSFERLIMDLLHSAPHALCPYCKGKETKKQCKACLGIGWVAKSGLLNCPKELLKDLPTRGE